MMRLAKMVTVCALAVSLVSTAIAQDQKREQGQGRRPGGFGGGLRTAGGGFGNFSLVTLPEVQKELGVSDEQKTKLEDVVKDVGDQARQGGNLSLQEIQNLSNEERQKRFEEMRKKNEELAKKANEAIAKILDAKQNERYGQLQLQREGVAAIARAEIADKMKLTKEQKEKVAKIQEEGRSAQRGGGNFAQLSDEERRELFTKAQAAREKVTADLAAVLTADQKASWEKMLGAKFDFPAPRGFGGGRPGGGEGGGDRKRPDAKK